MCLYVCISLQDKELPYDNFAYRETRCTGTGSSDVCTLFHVNASIVDLQDARVGGSSEAASNESTREDESNVVPDSAISKGNIKYVMNKCSADTRGICILFISLICLYFIRNSVLW